MDASEGPTLRSDRLLLRRWHASDRAPFATLNADPDVTRYLFRPLTPEESDALVDSIEAGFAERGWGLWAVQVLDDERFIGFTGLNVARFEAPFTPAVEVGWRLARSAWGYGYATEAATAALSFGFGSSGLGEVVSFTSPLNTRSMRVMQRLGMSHDPSDDFGHPGVPPDHRLHNHVLYRIDQATWQSRSVP
jgi:RimJ/RimL family protein N-acetyltransferase